MMMFPGFFFFCCEREKEKTRMDDGLYHRTLQWYDHSNIRHQIKSQAEVQKIIHMMIHSNQVKKELII